MFFVRAAAKATDLRVSSIRGSAGPIAHSMMKGSVKRLSAIFGGSEKSKKGSQANVACSGADLGDVTLLRGTGTDRLFGLADEGNEASATARRLAVDGGEHAVKPGWARVNFNQLLTYLPFGRARRPPSSAAPCCSLPHMAGSCCRCTCTTRALASSTIAASSASSSFGPSPSTEFHCYLPVL